jgi:hypothetical protein
MAVVLMRERQDRKCFFQFDPSCQAAFEGPVGMGASALFDLLNLVVATGCGVGAGLICQACRREAFDMPHLGAPAGWSPGAAAAEHAGSCVCL